MEINEVKKNPNKEIVISIRITPELSKWMNQNDIMPSKVFHKAIEELMINKGDGEKMNTTQKNGLIKATTINEKEPSHNKATPKKCVICGDTFQGYGNNAEPLKKGLCCDDCNLKVVAVRLRGRR